MIFALPNMSIPDAVFFFFFLLFLLFCFVCFYLFWHGPRSLEHVLQFRPLLREAGRQQRPHGVTPQEQLRVNAEDLLKTMTYILTTRLNIGIGPLTDGTQRRTFSSIRWTGNTYREGVSAFNHVHIYPTCDWLSLPCRVSRARRDWGADPTWLSFSLKWLDVLLISFAAMGK